MASARSTSSSIARRRLVVYAAMYDKERRPWQIIESGPESGIYKTEDGGDKWARLGGGLPTGKIGRIGLDIYQQNPLILYALLENQNPVSARRGSRRAGPRRRAAERGQSARARHHRQRALSHGRRRQDVAARVTR